MSAAPKDHPRPGSDRAAESHRESHHEEGHLLDKFEWLARLRRNPKTLFWYRVVVALLGSLMIVLALVTGLVPGPGGIPLALLGLAIWGTEFAWARPITRWVRRLLAWYDTWPSLRRRLFWVGVVLGILTSWWIVLAWTGAPGWAPEWLADLLDKLPWVQR